MLLYVRTYAYGSIYILVLFLRDSYILLIQNSFFFIYIYIYVSSFCFLCPLKNNLIFKIIIKFNNDLL
jgi:hypothetical protein